jgi:hypothetical protein
MFWVVELELVALFPATRARLGAAIITIKAL